MHVRGDVLDEFACLRVVCNESGGNGGCYQPQNGKTQIGPEELSHIFRKRFCSLGSMPGHCSKDTRGALYTTWKPPPRHSPGTCWPPELSSALQSIAVDLLRDMHMAFSSGALLSPQQSLLLLESGSNKNYSLTFMSLSTLLHQQWHCSQFLAEPTPDAGCSFYSSGHYRSVTSWTLSRATHESHGTQWCSQSSCVRDGPSAIQINKNSCVNITQTDAATDLHIK